jgi:uncharacterized lipoprotein YajG
VARERIGALFAPTVVVKLLLILAYLVLLSGCALRTCHTQQVPMFWVDGSTSSITVTTCHPNLKR